MSGARNIRWTRRISVAVLAVAVLSVNAPHPPAQAMMQRGLNDVVVRFCDSSTQNWISYPAPSDPKLIHQEIHLGQGQYTLTVRNAGNFRFDGYVYEGAGNRYIGGTRNNTGFTQALSVPESSKGFLVQLVKTVDAPGGVTMTLQSRNCPDRSGPSQPVGPVCRPNYCMSEPSVFGLSQQCIPRQGARGGVCGTPGN